MGTSHQSDCNTIPHHSSNVNTIMISRVLFALVPLSMQIYIYNPTVLS